MRYVFALAIALALCSSCSRRPGEASSARGSAARLANEPPVSTFEHPALEEKVVPVRHVLVGTQRDHTHPIPASPLPHG